jgi:hypothetical protein
MSRKVTDMWPHSFDPFIDEMKLAWKGGTEENGREIPSVVSSIL